MKIAAAIGAILMMASCSQADEWQEPPTGLAYIFVSEIHNDSGAHTTTLFEDERLFQMRRDDEPPRQMVMTKPEGSYALVKAATLAQLNLIKDRPEGPDCIDYGIDKIGIFDTGGTFHVDVGGCRDNIVGDAMAAIRRVIYDAGGVPIE